MNTEDDPRQSTERPDRPVPRRRAGRRSDKLATFDYARPKYPHNIHPALVPGIAVDEQRPNRFEAPGADRLVDGEPAI